MNREKIKKALPTVAAYLEKRQKAKQNQLPKHLRPLPTTPIIFHVLLNSAIIATLVYLIANRDEFLTEGGPGLALVVCLLLLIFTLVSAFTLRSRYSKIAGQRLASWNMRLMWIAFVLWAATVAFFLP
jgi:hypothetical protein